MPISGKATRPSSSMGWRPDHSAASTVAGWAVRLRLWTQSTGFEMGRSEPGDRRSVRTKARTEGLAEVTICTEPVPKTGNWRRTASIRRIQCRNELGLRCWASTLTAEKP